MIPTLEPKLFIPKTCLPSVLKSIKNCKHTLIPSSLSTQKRGCSSEEVSQRGDVGVPNVCAAVLGSVVGELFCARLESGYGRPWL